MSNLPKDIGGYQAIDFYIRVKQGDILVKNGTPIAFVSKADEGIYAGQIHWLCNVNVYRKMPVAKPGDLDDTGWKTKQKELYDKSKS